MSYIIVLNHFEGIELIVNSLRHYGTIAACDLAEGVEKYTLYQDQDGTLTKLEDMGPQPTRLTVVPS